jgi:hypothetical protein
MNISSKAWVFVGIILWGIPTGTMFAMTAALLKPGAFLEIDQFKNDVFVRSMIYSIPVFSFLGILIGLIIHEIAQRRINRTP